LQKRTRGRETKGGKEKKQTNKQTYLPARQHHSHGQGAQDQYPRPPCDASADA